MICKNCNKEIGQRNSCNLCGYDPVKDAPGAPEDNGMVFAKLPPIQITRLKSNNSAAVASFVLMFMSCLPFCGLLSFIFGIIGIVKSRYTRTGKALAIIAVVAQVLGVLLAFIFMIVFTSDTLFDGYFKEFGNFMFFG